MGGGNHFLELQRSPTGAVWLMLHPGSRGIGSRIGLHFIAEAKERIEREGIDPPSRDLAWLTQDLTLTMLFDRYRLSRSGASPALNVRPRYNGCPTQDFVAIRQGGEKRTLAKLRWGLVPSWSKDLKLGAKMINARSETVHEKPRVPRGVPPPAMRRPGERLVRVRGARTARSSRTGSDPRGRRRSRSPGSGSAGRRARSPSRPSRC